MDTILLNSMLCVCLSVCMLCMHVSNCPLWLTGASTQRSGTAAVSWGERASQDECGGTAEEDPSPPAGCPQGEEERPQHPGWQPGEHTLSQSLIY